MEPQSDLTIERMTEAAIPEADSVVMAAYHSPSRAAALRLNLALDPEGWRVARLDGRAVGVAGAVDYGPFAYIGQVGVLPDYQRHGIARALMRDLLGFLDARGCPAALLDATLAGAALYTQLGFVTEDTVTVWRPHTATFSALAPADGFSVAPLAEAYLPMVADFDAPHFGAARGAVLARLLAEAPGRAFVAWNPSGAVVGYLFARETQLGPWVAESPEAARTLLAAAQALLFAEPPQVLVPTINTDAASLLRAAGFAEIRTLQHMRRGTAPPVALRRALYGQASFALG